MNRAIVRHGLVLVLLALLTGFAVPVMALPELGLSAHVIGVLSGALLVAIGAVWPLFDLSDGQRAAMYWGWVYSSYANWLGCLIGGLTGAGRMTPVAAAGQEGAPLAEAVVMVVLVSVAISALVAVVLSIIGLRRVEPAAA